MRKNKKEKVEYIKVFSISSSLILLGLNFYVIYSNQINSVDDINIRLRQRTPFEMPQQVKVKLNSGKEKKCEYCLEEKLY